jgi:hypothetical protein
MATVKEDPVELTGRQIDKGSVEAGLGIKGEVGDGWCWHWQARAHESNRPSHWQPLSHRRAPPAKQPNTPGACRHDIPPAPVPIRLESLHTPP